jgi:hypothetical protein
MARRDDGAQSGGAMRELRRLWSGDMLLARAFWVYAALGGVAVNLVTSILFLVLLSSDWPVAALVAGYGVAVPYNTVALVGVWRAAGRHEGKRAHADLARLITLIGMALLTVI